ncbi:hypothetical protein ACIBCB_31250 [Streptomyces uncialis]|uniref:hypothetical protein n=1 Tax=Streptomyces uncialis TaxID=1048205 RepID=UPI0037A377B4
MDEVRGAAGRQAERGAIPSGVGGGHRAPSPAEAVTGSAMTGDTGTTVMGTVGAAAADAVTGGAGTVRVPNGEGRPYASHTRRRTGDRDTLSR